MKIALLGGSFDPIHEAHLRMAKEARKQLHVDEVWFLLAYKTPLKERLLTPYEHRKAMCEIALKPYRHYRLCTIEREMGGKSYTVNTLKALRRRYPMHEFYFLIGGDQLKQIDQWKDYEEMLSLATFCAFLRNEETNENPYGIRLLALDKMEASSTAVRQGCFRYVDKNVKRYIFAYELYLDFIREKMSDYRYEHSQRVAALCVELAKAHGLDVHKAYLCGVLHDINKEFQVIDKAKSKKILEIERPALLEYGQGVWHGYMGRYVCSHVLGIRDKDILMAIENHVLGECRNRYAMLLYVADKLEPGRKYDTSATIALCKRNLIEGYQEVVRQQGAFYGEDDQRGK